VFPCYPSVLHKNADKFILEESSQSSVATAILNSLVPRDKLQGIVVCKYDK
jgi:hypothetical protein